MKPIQDEIRARLEARGHTNAEIKRMFAAFKIVDQIGTEIAAERRRGSMYDNALPPAFEQHHGKRQEGDEYFCTDCRRRWDVHEEAPPCER